MNRRHFVRLAGGALLVTAGAAYLLSDRRNVLRSDTSEAEATPTLLPDEEQILFLASLAPSGHNTQPWFVRRLEPYHWIIGNDRLKWLPAVDPSQRETMLSLGAFLQNLEYAADALGYACQWTLLAATNQDEAVMEVKLARVGSPTSSRVENLKGRRTLRTGYRGEALNRPDLDHLVAAEPDLIHYLPASSREAGLINDQTIEANRLQFSRVATQRELAGWIRFSSADARKYRDGLTTGSMEIRGFSGWVVRNFYDQASVLKPDFQKRGMAQVREQVSSSAGWIMITSANASVTALIETGRRMQRLFLKVRGRGIGLHPMTQILEEPATRQALPVAVGLGDNVQFILRVGYVAAYPPPVSLRRPVARLLRS